MEFNTNGLTVFHKRWFTGTPVNAKKASLTTEFITENSNLIFESVLVGTDYNDLTVSYVDPGEGDAELSAELVGNDLIVSLETNETPIASTTVFGNADDSNEITITVDVAGLDGNDYVLEIVDPETDGSDLDASLNVESGVLSVSLATDDGDNAIATIGTYDDGAATPLITIEVVEAGSAGNDYTVEVVAPTEGTSALNATLTEKALVITLAIDAGDTDIAGNAASLIATAIEASGGSGVFNATVADGENDTRITTDETEKGFTGGGENYIFDDTANTVTLVATKINNEVGDVFTASFDSGDAANIIGADEVGEYIFTGGLDYSPTSTANDILAAVEDIDGIDEVLTVELAGVLGTGVVSYMEETNFGGGQYATPCNASAALIVIDDTIYFTNKPCTKYTEDAWYSCSETLL